jgi:DNA gyrase/topoisomerase IV subunit A
MTDEEINSIFKLTSNLNENITLIGFNNKVLERLTDVQVIEQFTEWRFGFYLQRFTKKLEVVDEELEFKKALLKVITSGLFKKFPGQKKNEIIQVLKDEKIKNPHIVRIMKTPIYCFGKDEVEKLEAQIKELEKNKKELEVLVKSEDKRRDVYIEELKK